VSFWVEGCSVCGTSISRQTNAEDYYYQSEISVGSGHRADGSFVSLFAAVDRDGLSSNFSVSVSEAGGGGASVEQVDDSPYTSGYPLSSLLGSEFSVPSTWDAHFGFSFHSELPEDLIVKPLPASVLFLLAGMGGLGAIARRKRKA
jgi:hypothetical protein